MRRSPHTLLGRVHERVRLEARGDAEALYRFLDPWIRTRLEEGQEGEPERTLTALRTFVATVRRAEVEEVEILEAHKVCERQGGRPAAVVRAIVRYNDGPSPEESHTVWVRDEGVWYATTTNEAR